MRSHGYSGRLATATLAVGGTMGIQVPPSVVLIIYAIITEQNIAKLFAAALLPALISAGGYLLTIYLYVRARPGEGPAQKQQSSQDI
ncbi:TRAP transporter large permease subunit, partial [Salmonella sp. SAL4360]|uniref:TRAP transporter large permease subunit n=1 Tax=Salmonella sp. SAL4360 TaxID=3159881 RepID=UPI00397AA057